MIHHDRQLIYPLLWLCLWLLSLSLLTFNSYASTEATSTHANKTSEKNSWQFDVFLDDSKIGYHHFSREITDGTEHIISEAEFSVRFMFFTVYQYRHSNLEQWRNGCLLKLESKTDDNGDEQFVNLSRDRHQSRIETAQAVVTTDGCIRSFAYWNLSHLGTSPLLNSQTGELMDVSLRKLGNETLLNHQRPVEASRYQLLGKDIQIDLWYTQDKQWLALQSTTENGSRIRYQLKPTTSQNSTGVSNLKQREQNK